MFTSPDTCNHRRPPAFNLPSGGYSPFQKLQILAGMLAATASFAFAWTRQDVIDVPLDTTPYAAQSLPAHPILRQKAGKPRILPVEEVKEIMTRIHRIPYEYSDRWMTMEELRAVKATDCKGKALLLWAEMKQRGEQRLRFVVGRRTDRNKTTHAWLFWKQGDQIYLLDPTFSSSPVKIEKIPYSQYIAQYMYQDGKKYRAAVIPPQGKR